MEFSIWKTFSLFDFFDYKFVDLLVFSFYKAKCALPKIGCASEVLRVQLRPIDVGGAVCLGLHVDAMICKITLIVLSWF